jgi:cation transport ATPase
MSTFARSVSAATLGQATVGTATGPGTEVAFATADLVLLRLRRSMCRSR